MLLGFQDNPYKYINISDAFICSSYAEGFSTAAMEALIIGKPIFSVNCSGMSELIGESNAGVIVENTDNELVGLLRRINSGNISIEDCTVAAQARGKTFGINEQIIQIENLLNE